TDVPIAGVGMKAALYAVNFLRAVAAAQIHFAAEVGEFDFAISGVQADAPLPWHTDFDTHAIVAEIHNVDSVRKAQVDFDSVAGLVLFDSQSSRAKLVVSAGDGGFNGFPLPRLNADVCVSGFDAQIGRVRNGVSLRPLLCARGHGMSQDYHKNR